MDRRMTKAERDDLVRLIRSRERIAKSAAQQRSAQMLVEFERQVSAAHAFDSNEVWNAAMEAGDRAVQEAMDKIEAESARLGIPEEFRPKLACYWQSRGSNAFSERRTELRRLAQAEIAAIEKAAFVQIEAQSVAAQTRIIADGLDSEAAIAFLNELPPVEQLMPPLDLNVIQATIADRARRDGGRLNLVSG
jgi:hypothetical protein